MKDFKIPKDEIVAELNKKARKLTLYRDYMFKTHNDSIEFAYKFDLNQLLEEYDELLGVAKMLMVADVEEADE